MRARISGKPLLAVAAVAGLALLAAPWATQRMRELPVVFAADAPADSADAPASGAIAPTPSAAAAARTPAAPSTAPRAQSDLRREFEDTPDLYAYAQRLQPAARNGDPEALWLISRVYDYCSPYALAPTAYARDTRLIGEMKLRGSESMVAARDRVSRRCARFLPEDDLSPQAIWVVREKAAEAGSLAAEAALLAADRPLAQGPEYRADLVDRVRRSQDAEAYAALSPAMGVAAAGEPMLADKVAGTQFAELAWQLAACRLGLDCGPDGALMTHYCANGGICSQDPQQDFPSFVYDAAIPRQGAEVVNEMVDSLVSE